MANLWVVCEVIIYLVTNELVPLRYRCDSWVASWVSLIGLGATYELFSLNQSIAWAILASVVIGALRLFTEGFRTCAVDYGTHDFSFPEGRATKIVENLNSSLKNLRSPAMGATRSHRQRVTSESEDVG